MPELPSGTVTFLFTDIERSTESAAALGDERWAEALQTHRDLLRPAFEKHSGVEVGTEGDSFFVAFARAGDAVAAAREGQDALEAHTWPGKTRLHVRMGLHTGEALVRNGGYVGHDVHKAKRISDAGHGGQILLSQTTADLIGTSTLVDLGPHRLKDLGEPQHIFQVGQDEFPRLRSLETFRHTLPAQRSSFIGREREIAQIGELLKDNQLVTIHGVGGCGKTRLAVQVGAELLHEFPDGAFFADLSPVADNEGILHVIADAVGIPFGAAVGAIPAPQETPSDDHILRYLSDRRCLLILDNCEHLLDACADFADQVLARCPHISILATSREALGVDGEQAWRLPSLSLPDDESTISASEAVSLFVARAKAKRSGFELSPTDAPAVAEICRRLDGIPLAIEFAAARVTHLSPKQIAQKLDDRFRLLTGGRRHVQRQFTLQAALDWSYDLLDEAERVLLRRLAVFPAEFSLEAAEGICSDEDLDVAAIFDCLASLVAKSLVDAEPSGDVVRYRLLETVRAYATDRLSIAGEAQSVRDRFSGWHRSWLESYAWDEVYGYSMVHRVVRESVNLRAAIEWSLANGRLQDVAAMAPRISTGAGVAGLGEDLRYWCKAALAADIEIDSTTRAACMFASTLGDEWDAERDTTLRQIVNMPEDIDPAVRSFVLAMRGILDGIIGAFTGDAERMESSRQAHRDALALAADLRPDFRLGIDVSDGMNEMDLFNLDAALAALERAARALAALPPADSDAARLGIFYYLGATLYAAGEYERAGELMLQAGAAAEATGIDVTNATMFLGGGAPAIAVADRAAAVETLTSSIGEVRRAHFSRGVEDWVGGAAGVLAFAGDHARAGRLLSWVRSRTIDRGIPPLNPASYVVNRHSVHLVREALGRAEAIRCRDEGRVLSEDEAVELALEGLHAL